MLTRHGRSGSTCIFLSTLLIEIQSVCVLTFSSGWYFLKYHIISNLNCHKHRNKQRVLTNSAVTIDQDKMIFCTLFSLQGLDIYISLAFSWSKKWEFEKIFQNFSKKSRIDRIEPLFAELNSYRFWKYFSTKWISMLQLRFLDIKFDHLSQSIKNHHAIIDCTLLW